MGIGAHADDVELYFGGTMLKYIDRGYRAVYVLSTNNMSGGVRTMESGGTWRKTGFYDSVATMEYRKREAAEAAVMYGTEPIHLDHPQRHCMIPDGKGGLREIEVHYGAPLPEGVPPGVPTILTAHRHSDAVERLCELILQHDPEVIFTHGHAERDIEHLGTLLLVVAAYEAAVSRGYDGCLLYAPRRLPGLGRMAHCWETFVDITAYVDRRMETVQKHASQFPPDFAEGARFYRELVGWRGKQCGVEAAEAFNFITLSPRCSEQTPLLNELVGNRCGKQPWGLLTPEEIEQAGPALPYD